MVRNLVSALRCERQLLAVLLWPVQLLLPRRLRLRPSWIQQKQCAEAEQWAALTAVVVVSVAILGPLWDRWSHNTISCAHTNFRGRAFTGRRAA